jgi:hypothetical protein
MGGIGVSEMGFSLEEVAHLATSSPRHAKTLGDEDPPRFWFRTPGESELAFRARVEAEACASPIVFY